MALPRCYASTVVPKFLETVRCVYERGHDCDHRDYAGYTWPRTVKIDDEGQPIPRPRLRPA